MKISSSLLIHHGAENEDLVDFRQHFPDFLWLLRDVTMKPTDSVGNPVSPTEYLKMRVLTRNPKRMPTPAEFVAMAITAYFPSLECLTLPPPSADMDVVNNITDNEDKLSPEFNTQLEDVVRYVQQKVHAKKGFNPTVKVNGVTLADLAEQYVNAINTSGAVPILESCWDAVIEQQITQLSTLLVAEYGKEMEDALREKLPMEECQLMDIHKLLLEVKRKILHRETRQLMPIDVSTEASTSSLTSKTDQILYQFERQIVEYKELEGGESKQEVKGGILSKFLRDNEVKSYESCGCTFAELYCETELRIATAFGKEATCTYTLADFCGDIERTRVDYFAKATGPAKHNVWSQKEHDVLARSKESFKQMVGFSEQVTSAIDQANEASAKAAEMSEVVNQLESKLKEKNKEMEDRTAERKEMLEEIQEQTRKQLEQELERQKEYAVSQMEESRSASEEKCRELELLCYRKIEELNETQKQEEEKHAMEMKNLKHGILTIYCL